MFISKDREVANQLHKKCTELQSEIKQQDKINRIYESTINELKAEANRNHLGSVRDFENKIKRILADCESKLVSSQ